MSSQLINQIASELAEAYERPDEAEQIASRIEKIVNDEISKRGPEQSLEQQVALERELRLWKKRIPQERLENKRLEGALNDLKFVLSYQHRGTTLKKVASWVSDHMTQVIAALAVTLAVILRASYSSFYQPLGLAPEEAGYDSGRILTQSLPGISILVLLLPLIIALISLPYQGVLTARRNRILGQAESQQNRSHMMVFYFLILMDLLIAFLFFSGRIGPLEKIPAPETINPALLGGLFGAIGGTIGSALSLSIISALILVISWRRKKLCPYVLFRWTSMRDAYLSALPTVAVLLLLVLPLYSIDRAFMVRNGTPVKPMKFLSLPVLGFTAELVTLEKKPDELMLSADDCVMYLGRTGDSTALYLVRMKNGEVLGGDLVRVPSSDLVVSKLASRGYEASCSAIGAIPPANPTNNGVLNRGFTTQQRNHFGSPTFGYVVAEEWAQLDIAAPGEGSVQGCSRWFLVFNAKGVQIDAVNVRDADTGAVLMTTIAPKKSNGAPSVQMCTPAFAQPDYYYVEVKASIRWSDNTLSQTVSFGSTISLR